MRLAIALVALLLPVLAHAAVYQVGADQQYKTVQDVLTAATPGDGDVILVHPGIYKPFKVTTGGGTSPETAPVIRAYDPANRPVVDATGVDNAVTFQHPTGKWYVLDGFEIRNAGFRGVFNVECGLVLRHCYIHDCRNGFMGGMRNAREESPGYLIAEYNEFARNGNGGYAHQLYVQEYWTVFRYNWIHDNTGGCGYKDRSRQSLLEYNLIEPGSGAVYSMEFCGAGDSLPDHTQSATLIGNIVTKQGGDNRWLFIANVRSEGGDEKALNVGRLALFNNTFYTTDHTGPMLGTDEGSEIVAENNVFQSTSCVTLLEQGMGTKGPGKVRGSVANWVNQRIALPSGFLDTVKGDDPGFVKAAPRGGDFHLLPGSPCVNAGSLPTLARLEYRHPAGWGYRNDDYRPDIGAFEARQAAKP